MHCTKNKRIQLFKFLVKLFLLLNLDRLSSDSSSRVKRVSFPTLITFPRTFQGESPPPPWRITKAVYRQIDHRTAGRQNSQIIQSISYPYKRLFHRATPFHGNEGTFGRDPKRDLSSCNYPKEEWRSTSTYKHRTAPLRGLFRVPSAPTSAYSLRSVSSACSRSLKGDKHPRKRQIAHLNTENSTF